MSGRSFLCDLWFSQTLRHKNYIYIHTYIHTYIDIYIYQKPKNLVVWEGRPNFSFLFKSCEILEVMGDLSINVEDKKSLRVDRQVVRK